MKGDYTYANGLSISQARKLFKFYFGDFFIKANKNDAMLRFDCYLWDKILTDKNEVALLEDWCDLEYFDKYWNHTHLGTGSSNNKEGVFNIIISEQKIIKK